jgi:hypothetical protein
MMGNSATKNNKRNTLRRWVLLLRQGLLQAHKNLLLQGLCKVCARQKIEFPAELARGGNSSPHHGTRQAFHVNVFLANTIHARKPASKQG